LFRSALSFAGSSEALNKVHCRVGSPQYGLFNTCYPYWRAGFNRSSQHSRFGGFDDGSKEEIDTGAPLPSLGRPAAAGRDERKRFVIPSCPCSNDQVAITEMCRRAGISQPFNGRKKYDCAADEMGWLKQLEDENAKLKKLCRSLAKKSRSGRT